MKTKSIGMLSLFIVMIVLAIPIAQVQAISMTPEDRLPSGRDAVSNPRSGTANGIRSQIAAETQGSSKKNGTVKEIIGQRKGLLESLKEKLLSANPQERANITAEINAARLEGLADIRASIKTPEDTRAFHREKFSIGLDLCDQLKEHETCKEMMNQKIQRIENLSESELQKLNTLSESSANIKARVHLIENLEGNSNLKVFIREDESGKVTFDVRARKIPESKIAEIQNKMESLNINELKMKADSSKKGFFRLKIKADSCKDENTTGCQTAKQELTKNAKEFLLNTVDNLIAKLEKMKLTIQSETSITENESIGQAGQIDKIIAEVKDLRIKIEVSADSEIKTKLKETAEKLGGLQPEIQKVSGFVEARRMGGILIKASSLSAKLNRVLERMILDKADITESAKVMAEFNAELDLLKKDFEAVESKFRLAASADFSEKAKLIKEAQDSMKSFKERTKTLQQKIQSFLKDLKQNSALKSLDETKVDVAIEG